MARRLSVQEIKSIIESEMKDAQRPETVTVKQRPWWDVKDVLENEIDWLKALKIKEIFASRIKKNG